MNVVRWEISLASLDPVIGSEQGKTRPVLVLSSSALNNILPVVNIVPLTSRKQDRRVYPNEALIPKGKAGLNQESIALCYQIRTLDKKRLIKRFGVIDDLTVQAEIMDAMKFQLSII
ncbi:MAG: type II toxin-antitoxin system PemK/MazF family toxin [Pyrinomonadaceae bacterium]|nr:type II toxin-antitoxin system PemK/MazF family toxin [Pyrinomonadaceae bacterium]